MLPCFMSVRVSHVCRLTWMFFLRTSSAISDHRRIVIRCRDFISLDDDNSLAPSALKKVSSFLGWYYTDSLPWPWPTGVVGVSRTSHVHDFSHCSLWTSYSWFSGYKDLSQPIVFAPEQMYFYVFIPRHEGLKTSVSPGAVPTAFHLPLLSRPQGFYFITNSLHCELWCF